MKKKIVIILIFLIISLMGCIQDYLVAPEGTTLYVNTYPTTIYYENDYSLITVTAFEASGRPIRDDVAVYFFTDLGTITPEAKTKDGKAVVKLYSDKREGTATVKVSMPGAGEATVSIEIIR
jgi:hypothetical protein